MHRHPEPIPFLLQQTLPLPRLKTLHPAPFTDPNNGLLFVQGDHLPINRVTITFHKQLVQRNKGYWTKEI
jgi:hypothetical protein